MTTKGSDCGHAYEFKLHGPCTVCAAHRPQSSRPEPLSIGTKTPWGEVSAIHFRGGERYYFILDAKNAATLHPAEVVERAVRG